MPTFVRPVLYGIFCIFAVIGFIFTGVFVAMQLDLLNVRGSIDSRNQFFLNTATTTPATRATSTSNIPAPSVSTTTQATPTPARVAIPKIPCTDTHLTSCTWNQTPEWKVIERALVKDAAVLKRVAAETGVHPRMIASVVVPEQIRFFTSNREVFKRWFEPMKLLGSLSQFSLGVSGIKEDTAERIESYTQDTTSPWYPGIGMDALIAHQSDIDPATDRFNRLTDEKDHYYSYLYTALFIKEVVSQWEGAGYDISDNPEVIVTLFNLGFDKSVPNATPSAGGAPITVGGTTYTYGTLGGAFYRSDELLTEFPR